jgi:hypothetical protein
MDGLQISPDSKHILVRKSGRVVILDAFDGTRKHDLGQGNVSVAYYQ